MFFKTGVRKSFAIFTGKHLCLFIHHLFSWMFWSKKVIQIVEKVQYKMFQVVYKTCILLYHDFLALDNKLKIHQGHLLFLVIEVHRLDRRKPNSGFKWTLNTQKTSRIHLGGTTS